MKANWKILKKIKDKRVFKTENIVDVLLENRGLSTRKEKKYFLKPIHPKNISLEEYGISKKEVSRVLKRLDIAKKNKEEVIVYGDYDADGICGTAILWEAINETGINCLPYIPERFSEGYGIKFDSVKRLVKKDGKPGLIITVDNGIVAHEEINKINKIGIDVVVTDHHEKERGKPEAHAIVHSKKVSGSMVSWILSLKIRGHFNIPKNKPFDGDGLDLATIGTIADQMELIGINRSVCYHGLKILNVTKRPGLKALFESAVIKTGLINAYTVGFVVAPRLNSAGRLTHAIESLRLLCTKKTESAQKQTSILEKTNSRRQNILEDVVKKVKKQVESAKLGSIIIISDESYHEGIIGLAAGRLVEVFYRPSIVISRGEKISKASCRSISGFNIIEKIKQLKSLIESGGGHPMAAGFSIKSKNIDRFKKEMQKIADLEISKELLNRKLKIDLELPFEYINNNLLMGLKILEPSGMGNPVPTFMTRNVEIKDFKIVGGKKDHLKLTLQSDKKNLDSIGFGFGYFYEKALEKRTADVVYNIEENTWNGNSSIQLKIKDIDI